MLSVGKPIVGTDVGGIPEILLDGETGRIVPPADSDALADGISRLLRDEAARERLGANARDRALRQFSWKSIAARTTEIYASAISSATHSS